MQKEILELIDLIEYSEGLKREIRNSWLSDKRQESVAEHSWRMALMASIIGPRLTMEIDLNKSIKMAIFHDISEIEAGDVPTILHMTNSKVSDKKTSDEQYRYRQPQERFPHRRWK